MTDETTDPPDDPSHPPTRARKRAPRARGTKRERDPVTQMFVSKLTDELVDNIVGMIERQAAPETACVLAGVNVRTFRQWIADGRAWLEAHDDDEIPIPQAVLTARVERAYETAKQALVDKVAGADDWRAAMEILQRRHSREFAKRDRIDVGNPEGEEFRIAGRDLSVLSPEQLRSLREIQLVLHEAEQGADVIELPARRRELGSGS